MVVKKKPKIPQKEKAGSSKKPKTKPKQRKVHTRA